MSITYEGILKEIASKQYRPLYYLMGEEAYYIDRLTERFANDVLDEAEKGFNQVILYGHETHMRDIIAQAKRYPMMAERQVIIVREAQNLKNEITDLAFYLQKPQPTTLMVFCHKNGSLDMRKYKKLVGDIEKIGGAVFESKKVKEDYLPYFIRNKVKAKQLEIDDKAIMMLAESVGPDLGRLASELDKLFINITNVSSVITPDMVEAYTGISKEYNVFELKNALIEKNVEKANRIAKYMEENPKTFPMQLIFPILFSYFANLMMAFYAKPRTPDGIAAYLGMKSTWGTNDYIMGMRNYSAFKVMDIISEIRRYDGMSKGVGATANMGTGLLRQLIYFILH